MNYFYLFLNKYICNLNIGNYVDFLFLHKYDLIKFKIEKDIFRRKIICLLRIFSLEI
jgi:hypothetical protein